MIHEATAQGATIEEALQKAKDALNAPADADVQVELLTPPQKGLLGLFGKKKAEARAYYETPDAPQKKPAAPKEQPRPQQAHPQKQQPQKAPQQKQQPAQKKDRPAPQKKEQPKPQPQPAVPAEEETRTEFALDSKPGVKAGADYLLSVIAQMGVQQASVKAFVNADNEVLLDLDCGEDYGIVIGRRGETLDAIQYLTRLVASKHKTEGEYARISINIGDYREKRKVTLANLARKNAERVLKYGRNFTFEPMNPYERRIIHTTVQEMEGVTSHSVGSDDERRVVITLAEGVKPTHPSKGGGRSGRNSRGRGPRGGGNRQSSQTVASPARAPKTDAGAEGVSLYGKLN